MAFVPEAQSWSSQTRRSPQLPADCPQTRRRVSTCSSTTFRRARRFIKQNVMIPNSYNGIAFDPSQSAFYVSSGMGDFPFDSNGYPNPANPQYDNVHVFTLGATKPGRRRPRRCCPT